MVTRHILTQTSLAPSGTKCIGSKLTGPQQSRDYGLALAVSSASERKEKVTTAGVVTFPQYLNQN